MSDRGVGEFDCGATGVSPVQPGGDTRPPKFSSENQE